MHSKGNNKQNKKTTHGLGENVFKQWDQHGINFQNAETAHNTKKLKNKQTNTNQKMGIRPKETFLQRGHTDGQ